MKVLLDKVAILFAPLKREGSWRNALAWTRTTRSGSPSLLVDSVTCVVAVRVVDGAGVEEHGAKPLPEADAPWNGAPKGPRPLEG